MKNQTENIHRLKPLKGNVFVFNYHAETEGFEPSRQLPAYILSRDASSATRANLH